MENLEFGLAALRAAQIKYFLVELEEVKELVPFAQYREDIAHE
jgi:hypothetical protein